MSNDKDKWSGEWGEIPPDTIKDLLPSPAGKLAVATELLDGGILCSCFDWRQDEDSEMATLHHGTDCTGREGFKKLLGFKESK